MPRTKYTRLMVLLTLCAAPLSAQTLDQYGGVVAGSCVNPNGNKYFGKTIVNNRIVLCDPAGHPYFGRGFYQFSFSAYGKDETGKTYMDYNTAKYGSPPSYNWAAGSIGRMKSWGFNMVGPEAIGYAYPYWSWVPSGTNPNKVPFVYQIEPCYNSWANTGAYGPWAVKDLQSVRSSFWPGYVPGSGGPTDYPDPAWATYVGGLLGKTGSNTLKSATASDQAYLIGVSACDSDYLHGLTGGPDFDTASLGANDWRLSWMVTLASPVEWASSLHSQIYPDPTVYSKKALYTQVAGEYSSVDDLNNAWGTGGTYTTFGTSGTCYGANLPSWLCPSPSAAAAVGTGNGSNVNFSTTLTSTVSANSLGIFVGSTLVGGDNGKGSIYGPSLSGTINYTSGVLSLTFASAPANGALVTAQYIANGWGIGTGLMDEDGRTSHQTWTGHNPVCIGGASEGTTAACSGWGSMTFASAGMTADMNKLDITLARSFASTIKSAITGCVGSPCKGLQLPGALFIGPTTWATWSVPPNRYVIQGMAPYVDVMQGARFMAYGGLTGPGTLNQAAIDFVHTWTSAAGAPDMAFAAGSYRTANPDSPLAWPGTACAHSGASVTCTLATPQSFTTSSYINTYCDDATYNATGTQKHPTFSSGSTLTYTLSVAPTNPSATCNVTFAETGFHDATQTDRGNAVASQWTSFANSSYSANGVKPYVMAIWWQWVDSNGQGNSYGIVDTRDNAYNGVETTTAVVPCSPPLQTYNCGGELRSGWGSDDAITPIVNANRAIDSLLGTSVKAGGMSLTAAGH